MSAAKRATRKRAPRRRARPDVTPPASTPGARRLEARPVPSGYATRTSPLQAGPAARVTGGTRTGPSATEIAQRFYEVSLPPVEVREAKGALKEREDRRLRRIVEERARTRAHPVRSDYFGTAEHRAIAEYVVAMLQGRRLPFKQGPLVEPSHVLFAAEPGALGPDATPIPLSPELVKSADPSWRDRLQAELAEVLQMYDPLRELEVRPGIALRYGEIVALAGDYYETPDELASEITQPVADAIRNVTPDSDGTFLLTIHRGAIHYLDLALGNVDHFAPCSWTRYAELHREALLLALEGRDLERALARNAFADHFLTDAFASGHLRTPRRIDGALPAKVSKGLQAKKMHDEENLHGLWVQNGRGYVWRAYGDDRIGVNPVHATLVAHALGASIQRVYAAYELEGDAAAALREGLQPQWTRPAADAGDVRDPRELLPAWLGKVPAQGEASAPAGPGGGALRDILALFPVPVASLEKPRKGFLANYPPRRTGRGADRGDADLDAYFSLSA